MNSLRVRRIFGFKYQKVLRKRKLARNERKDSHRELRSSEEHPTSDYSIETTETLYSKAIRPDQGGERERGEKSRKKLIHFRFPFPPQLLLLLFLHPVSLFLIGLAPSPIEFFRDFGALESTSSRRRATSLLHRGR